MTPLSLRCLIFSSMQIQRQTKQYYPNINVSHICSLKFSSSHIFESGRKQKNIFQFSSVAQSCPTLCDPMNCNTPGLPVHHHLPEFIQTHIHQVGDAIQPSHPLFFLPPIPPSIRVFFNESTLHMRWPKYWSFSFSISPSNEHLGRVSFRMDWLDLLAGQGTLKSLLQHRSSKASILRCSAFFTVQLSHPYMATGKTIYVHIRIAQGTLCKRGISL